MDLNVGMKFGLYLEKFPTCKEELISKDTTNPISIILSDTKRGLLKLLLIVTFQHKEGVSVRFTFSF